MTFKERVETHPIGWLVGVAGAAFVAGVFAALSVVQIVIADRGPRVDKLSLQSPVPTPSLQFASSVSPTFSPNSASTPAAGEIDATIQEFIRRFNSLDGRYAEQEDMIKRANGKHVNWQVVITRPVSIGNEMTLYFDVPAESADAMPLFNTPVRWADFPPTFRERLFALKRGDVVTIEGTLKALDNDSVAIRASDFKIVALASPTVSPAR